MHAPPRIVDVCTTDYSLSPSVHRLDPTFPHYPCPFPSVQYKDVKPVSTAQADLQFSDGLRASIKQIRDDSSPTNWCVDTVMRWFRTT
jgi:hypothetical protein